VVNWSLDGFEIVLFERPCVCLIGARNPWSSEPACAVSGPIGLIFQTVRPACGGVVAFRGRMMPCSSEFPEGRVLWGEVSRARCSAMCCGVGWVEAGQSQYGGYGYGEEVLVEIWPL